MSDPRRIAAVDLGTNTTLMLVAQIDERGVLRVLEDRATITRLGRGVDRTRLLDVDAMQRTLAVLRDYARIADGWGARIVAVGTSALRDATNRDEFLIPARAILGTEIQTIAGAREAELTFRGALEGIDVGVQPLTVVDIGGGSTEIIIGAAGKITQRTSLDIGSVRMHERHRMSAPGTSAQESAVRDDVRAMIAAEPDLKPVPRLLAIAGTATTLAAMAGHVDPYDPARVHGSKLTRDVLHSQVQELLSSSMEARRRMPGLDPARADVIAAGAIILDELLRWTGAAEVTVSDGGVRFGLVREAFDAQTLD